VRAFKFTELEAEERLVFGPVTFTKTASFSGGIGSARSSVSKTSGHTAGVTNRRVIVEDINSPEKTQEVQNAAVERVYIRRKQQKGRASITLWKVQAASGQSLKLDIKGLPAQAEGMMQTMFPNAEIIEEKAKGCGCPIAAVIPMVLVLAASILIARGV